MDIDVINTFRASLEGLVATDFEKQLLDASLKNLLDSENKLRFNNFACGIRELSRHVLLRLAPDEEVKACIWFQNETKKENSISRGERVKHAIQAGLPDNFLSTFFDIQDYKDSVLHAISLLNKYTHVNENTFDVSEIEVEALSGLVFNAYADFINAIIECRSNLKAELEEQISQVLIEHTLFESIDDLDMLSTHHEVEETYVSEYHITEMTSTHLIIAAEGTLDVRQQYGSNSDVANDIGMAINSSFPFKSTLSIEMREDLPDGITVKTFEPDIESWYK